MSEPQRRSRLQLGAAVAVALVVIVIDQSTKALALDRLRLGEPVHVIGTLKWQLVYNRGSAFGLGDGFGPLIGVFALGMALIMLVLAWNAPKLSYGVVYGLIAGGAVGNVLDRIFRVGNCPGDPCTGFMGGAVIDFINLVDWWWVFNVADMAVVVGVMSVAVGAVVLEGRAAPVET